MRINLSAGQVFSTNKPIRVAPGASVTFFTDSASDPESASFTSSPFTDGTTSVEVAGSPGQTYTVSATTTNYPMSISGDRTGELDVTPGN